MYSHLLKKALPFTLTLILGATVAGMFKPHHPKTLMWTWPEHSTPLLGREGPFDGLHEHRHSCDMRRHNLVAETKPLVITSQPNAQWPRGLEVGPEGVSHVWVQVTFGADGKVHEALPVLDRYDAYPQERLNQVWSAVYGAAREIRFEPETINGMPVSVTKDVLINFALE
ncbi:MAG: hypothetical protein QOJ70_3656 [Acidobacteriota bacterium]|jgi:hypothetical protein|nr:hypothetical protein [Acidobacteriota bacterium]